MLTYRPNTTYLIVVLIIGCVGIGTNLNAFDLESWLTGFLAFVIVPTLWFASRAISFVLRLTTFLLLVGLTLSPFIDIDANVVFFSGAFFGSLVGLVVAYFVHRPYSYRTGLKIAKEDNYPTLVKYFENKISEVSE